MNETAVLETQESQQNKANQSQERKPWHFTSANARELARKSHETRKANEAKLWQDNARLEHEAELVKPIIQAAMAQASAIAVQPEDQYRLERLRITREQLKVLDGKLSQAEDERAVKAICDAMRALQEIESNLAMRPKPGSRRPTREKPMKSTQGEGLVED